MNVHPIVRGAIDEINLRLPRQNRIEATPSSVLLGDGSSLDSAAFLDFLLILEQKIEEQLGRQVSLVNDDAFDPVAGPLRTVGSLESHLASLLRSSS